jgi:non-structural maintenance of chromosomes element 1
LATEYSAVEIAYFKAIVCLSLPPLSSGDPQNLSQIEQIMLAPREAFSISSMLALREVSELKSSMTKTQAEVVLNSFVIRGWLLKSKWVL